MIHTLNRRELLALLPAMGVASAAELAVEARRTAKENWTRFPTRTLEQLPSFRSSKHPIDRFGARKGKRLRTTGFFRAEKAGRRWWLVDPDGYPCIQPSVTSVRPGESERASAALKEKFGSNEKWAEAAIRLLRENGFTAIGAWSDTALLNKMPDRLPWYTTLSFMGGFGKARKLTVRQPGHVGFVRDCMPVFHPEFAAWCDEYAAPLAASKNDRLLVGHFSDNELPAPPDLLNRFLELDASDTVLKVNRDAARVWLAGRKNSSTADPASITDEDREAFREHVYEKYLALTTAAIRKYDPNHICFGPRLWGPSIQSKGIMRACGRHLEVIAVNIYHQWATENSLIEMWRSEAGKPYLVTEFYAKGEDSGLPNTTGAGWLVHTQQDRARFYQHFTLAAIESRDCVGWQWLNYLDNDPQNKKAELSNLDANKGILNIAFEPYKPLLAGMKAINENVYALADYFDSRA